MIINEHMSKLFEQSTTTHQGWCERVGNYRRPYFDKHKFAASVVVATLDQVEQRMSLSDNPQWLETRRSIIEHFADRD